MLNTLIQALRRLIRQHDLPPGVYARPQRLLSPPAGWYRKPAELMANPKVRQTLRRAEEIRRTLEPDYGRPPA